MRLEITISDAEIANFSKKAIDALKNNIQTISKKIVEEAYNVEKDERQNTGQQEVTSSNVNKAADVFIRRSNEKKWIFMRNFNKVVTTISSTLTGIFFTMFYANTDHTVHIWAIICLVVCIISLMMSIFNKP